MPVETVWTAQGVEWRLTGVLSFGELQELNLKFMSDPRSDRARYQLMDARAMERLDAEAADVKLVGAFDNAQSRSTPHLRIAIIVPADGRFDDHVEAYKSMMGGSTWVVRSFTDEAAARDWVAERDEGAGRRAGSEGAGA